MNSDPHAPRYRAVLTSIESDEPGLQLNRAAVIHLAISRTRISSVRISVGYPRWDGDVATTVFLRIGWTGRRSEELPNSNNSTQDDYRWLSETIFADGDAPYRLRLETLAAGGAWPTDTGSFRLENLEIDGSPIPFADWAYWIEEDTTCPGPGDQTGAPPTCIAFPGRGDACPVCAPSTDGIAGICPLVRHTTGFRYQQYIWHGRFYWCKELPF